VIDPRELQREANVILDVLGQDLQEGKPKDAMRLLQAIVGNPLVDLARIGCTKTEAAIMLGCSVDTLDRRFAEFFQLGDVQGKTQLRRKQHLRAVEDGSDNMLQFLGKHRLGQTDVKPDLDINAALDDALTDPSAKAGDDPAQVP
jgi:hypothetical protein